MQKWGGFVFANPFPGPSIHLTTSSLWLLQLLELRESLRNTLARRRVDGAGRRRGRDPVYVHLGVARSEQTEAFNGGMVMRSVNGNRQPLERRDARHGHDVEEDDYDTETEKLLLLTA